MPDLAARIAARSALRQRIEERNHLGILGTAKEAVAQLGRGLADSGYSTAVGLNELLGQDDSADYWREAREEAHGFYGDARTATGKVAGVLGRVAGEGAQFMAPGAIAGDLAKGTELAKFLAPASRLGKVAVSTLLDAPLNIAKSQDDEGNLASALGMRDLSPTKKALLEVGGQAVAGQALEGAARLGGKVVRPIASPILRAGRRALEGLTDFTGNLDEALETGAKQAEREMRPAAFTPEGLEAGPDALRARVAARRQALEQEPPSTISQLLRQARDAQLTAPRAQPGEIPLKPRPTGVPSLRDALRSFDAARYGAAARNAPPTLESIGRRLAAGEDIPDEVVDQLPTLTPHDTPAIKRARAEQAVQPSTHEIPDEAPATSEHFPAVRTRGELRQSIVDRLYGTGAPKKDRQAFVIMGPPAAGKSTVADPIAAEHGALVIDSDQAKELLPEFHGGRFAGAVHEESVGLHGRLSDRAFEAGDNVVLPIVGRSQASVERVLAHLQAHGYTTHLLVNELPAAKAAERGILRWQKTGRFVDPHYIVNAVGDRPAAVFQEMKSHPAVSTFRRYSNDVPQGSAPLLLESGGPGLGAAVGGADRADHLGAGADVRAGASGAGPSAAGAGRAGGAELDHVARPHDREAPGTAGAGEVVPAAPRTATGRPRLTGIDGHDAEAFFQEREVPVRYRVVEADELIPSNHPETFERDARYPQVIQGRAYHGEVGRAAREQVIAGTQALNPKKLLNPGSNVGGPPIITPDGLAIAGNQRSMMLMRAARAEGPQYQAYRQLLEERAGRFGVDPAQLRGMTHPVLVRELADPTLDVADHDVLRQLNAASDTPTMKTKDPLSDANTRALQLRSSPAALEHLAANLDPEETVRQHLERSGLELFRQLQESGVVTPQELARFYDRSAGKVTEEGKTLVERMLQLAAVPNPDVVKAAPDAILRRLEHGIPAIVAAGTRPAWSLEKPLTQALELVTAAKRSGVSVREFLQQQDAFGRTWSDEAAALGRLLDETKKPTAIAEKFRQYAEAAAASERQGGSHDIFGAEPEGPAEAFGRVFDAGAPAGSGRPGSTGVHLMSSIAGGGVGGLAGATQGDTPEERARNAALGFAAGAAGVAAIPYLLHSAGRVAQEGRAALRGLRVDAAPHLVVANLRGETSPQQLEELIAQVRANPRAKFRYVVRDENGKAIGTGTSLADFFADAKHRLGNRTGAIGTQPAAGAGSPLRGNRLRPGYTPPPKPNAAPAAAAAAAPPAPDIDPEDYFNFSKVLLDPSGEQRLRAAVTDVVQREGLSPKQRVSWEQTKKIARSLGLNAEDLVAKGEVQRLSGAEMLAIRNILHDNIGALERMSQQLATNPALAPAERELLERNVGAIERQNDVLLARFVKARTQTGRDLNSLKIIAEGSLDPTLWLVRAKRQLGDRALTPEIRTRITELLNRADRAGLATYVAKLRTPTPWEKLVTVWKAGLLTAPTTHLANLLGNTTMAALETAKDVPAAGLDALFSAVTGQRTKDANVLATAAASLQGARKGLDEARAIMAGRTVGEGLDRYDLSREIDFNNAFLDRYTKTVFRSLSAADRIFRSAALQRSLAEQARVLAKAQRFTGDALAQEVARLTKNPTDAMALQAIHDAEIATFQNKGALGRAAKGLRRPLGVAGEVLLPFTQTPANVAERVVEYSPLGALSTIPDVVRLFSKAAGREGKAALQKKIVERLGRSTIGSLPILAGYWLASHGRITAGLPQDQTERDQWQLEQKQPNSVKIGGKWHSLERISPLGNLMVFGAHLQQAWSDQEKSLVGKLGSSVGAIGKTVEEQSFLQGLSGAMDAVKDPERFAGDYLRSTAASVVPNIVTRVARATDPTLRERETTLDEIKSRIPGLSSTLPAKFDQFGAAREHQSGLGALFDPTNATRDRTADDPILAELERVGAQLPRAKRGHGETPEAFRRRQQQDGPILKRVVSAVIDSPQYRDARHIAEVLSARDPRFRGRDPRELANELQRGILEDAVSAARRQLTLAHRTP